jgi:hypothetical protein
MIKTKADFDDVLRGVGLNLGEVDEHQMIIADLLYQSALAREDVRAFFEFVMRHETTGKELRCAPHQRVLLEFAAKYPRCVIRMPVGTSKTFSMAALTLHMLGRDPSGRGAIVSSTQAQAMKPLAMVRDIIEENRSLQMVFSNLRKSPRKTDSWSQSEITIDRPPGIRDPSLIAVGIDGAIAGARLSWIVVDDILDRENTSTPAGLQKVHDWFDSSVLSRIDPGTGRIVVTNTPWHPEDLTYRLEAAGWPTLTIDVLGNVKLANCDDFDSDDIVPSARPGDVYRLAVYNEPRNERGEVVEETSPLWPERYSWADIEQIKATHLPHRFNQLYLCICRSDETSRCKLEWIDRCKANGRGMTLSAQYTGGNMTITGVDLAIGKGSQYDQTALFTFEQLPDGRRVILDVEYGQWDAPTIVTKIIGKAQNYKSIVRVENNAAQDYLVQFARARNASIPIKAHTTGRSKAHPEYGVEGLFIELQNGAWAIPSDSAGRCHPAVQRWIDECLYFAPDAHVGDVLMASWLAREQAREMGLAAGVAMVDRGMRPGLASSLFAR